MDRGFVGRLGSGHARRAVRGQTQSERDQRGADVTNRQTELTGTLVDAKGQPAPDYTITSIPRTRILDAAVAPHPVVTAGH